MAGLLATRPEVVAYTDGGTEHVAEARAASAAWIAALSPAVAAPLVAWLRAAAAAEPVDPAAVAVARALLDRLIPPSQRLTLRISDTTYRSLTVRSL